MAPSKLPQAAVVLLEEAHSICAMKARSAILFSRYIAFTALLVGGCHRKEPATSPNGDSPKDSVVLSQVPQANATNAAKDHWTYLPVEGLKMDDSVSLWQTLDFFQGGYSQLKEKQFVDATKELLKLRAAMGIEAQPNSFLIAAKVEDTISRELTRRVGDKTLSLKEADQLVRLYLAPVFNRSQLERLAGYPANATQATSALSVEKLLEVAYDLSGGDDGIMDDFPEKGDDAYFVKTKKPFGKLTLICNARNRVAALQAYVIFSQKGGDSLRRPLYEHIKEIVPDVLGQYFNICPGLVGVLDAGDIENLVLGNY